MTDQSPERVTFWPIGGMLMRWNESLREYLEVGNEPELVEYLRADTAMPVAELLAKLDEMDKEATVGLVSAGELIRSKQLRTYITEYTNHGK